MNTQQITQQVAELWHGVDVVEVYSFPRAAHRYLHNIIHSSKTYQHFA
jgi:predicted CoA-binding protein